ncbi:MAG: response regulator [Balneolaceae bacterium]|nr:response regulator [Balneolaceae bacterium]MBO6545075.1 response regulator [Balneolaceae bacterium]MBO6646471.1 response regulator [Balneolaceae bacterium]
MSSAKEEKSFQNTTSYTLYGLTFGLAFPVIATLFDINIQGLSLSLDSVVIVQSGNPLHWIIDTAPFFLGSLSALAGYRKDQTDHLNRGLERMVAERTDRLEKKNELLKSEIENRKKTEKALVEAKEQAEAGARAKTQFLSTMSHEIRTPLNAVIGMSGLLTDTELNNEQHDFVNTINKSGENLLGIINNILDYAKIESGKLDLEEVEFSVAFLIEDVLDLVSATEADKNIELLYRIDENVPDYVKGDSTRVQQILVNLVRNAIKFTEEGEVVIFVQSKKMEGGNIELMFEVKDTGIGIPKEKQKKLFQSFSQVDASTTRKFGGTGLGLAICKRLVELMNGEISVKSEEGVGSSFIFNLKAKGSTRKLGLRNPEHLKGRSIFILDDNDTNLFILKAQCEKAGMNVKTYQSPMEVLNSVEELKKFDIGILDMHMPDRNGVQVAEAIREKFSKMELPLVLLSSIMDLGSVEERKKFNLYLTKPIKQTHLHHNLERVFGDVEGILRSRDKEDLKKLDLGKKLKILLAEDNAINQKVASKMLERLDQSCDVAGNGIEAVQMCRLINYDLVLMDMEMPEMDGIEATKMLNKIQDDLGKLPVIIAMTANAMEEDKKKCLEAGMHDFLPKPVKLEAMHEVLKKWFKE